MGGPALLVLTLLVLPVLAAPPHLDGYAQLDSNALVLRECDREELEGWTRSATVPAAAAKRARIVLLSAEGMANSRFTESVDSSLPMVLQWRDRYQPKGLAGLADVQRPGTPRTIDYAAIVAATLTPPPKELASRTGRVGCSPSG